MSERDRRHREGPMSRFRFLTYSAATETGAMKCTCHPSDNPPTPCPQKYAYSECEAARDGGSRWER